MAILLIIISSLFVSISNFFMRRSIDGGGTTKGFLVFQMLMGFWVAVLLGPVQSGHYEINFPIAFLGVIAGVILAVMLYCLGRALEKGPPGLTFSILNASTVVPGLVMAALFGAALGYPYTSSHAMGSALVLGGLFWAGRGGSSFEEKKKWIFLTLSVFALHSLLLVLFQWRALLLNQPHPEELFSLFTQETIRSAWFAPFMFLSSFVFQVIFFVKGVQRLPYPREVLYGLIGGMGNGLCTYFMIRATEVAGPLENAILFPVFSVVTILISNLWGQKLYQERVNWRACQLCAVGLVVGTVDWPSVAALIGFGRNF